MHRNVAVTMALFGALLLRGRSLANADTFHTTRPIPNAYLTDRPAVLPPDPLLLETTAPPALGAWLRQWVAGELKGESAAPDTIENAGHILSKQDIPLDLSGQVIELIASLDGNAVASPLFPIVLNRAEAELGRLSASDPRGRNIAASLWPMHDIFWSTEDRQSDCRLVHVLLPFEVRGSGHSQWARYTYAELLYFLNKNPDAYYAYKDVQAERESATEPSEGVNRPLNWELGLSASAAGRHLEAAGYFEAAANQFDFASARAASVGAFTELNAAGKHEEAITKFKDHVVRYKLSRDEAAELATRLTDSHSGQ